MTWLFLTRSFHVFRCAITSSVARNIQVFKFSRTIRFFLWPCKKAQSSKEKWPVAECLLQFLGGSSSLAHLANMKTNDSKGIWPAELVQYKEIIDANPNYSSYTEEEKILLADRIMNSTYADLTNNWAFQWVFLNNPEILIMFLADILEEDIVSISYLPNQGLAATVNDKQASLDVICHTTDGRQFIVEMQHNRKSDFRNRIFFYGASAIHRQVKAGDTKYDYDSVRIIAIQNFITSHGVVPRDKILFRYEFREAETQELYGTQMRLYMLELPRMKKAGAELNKLEEWCYMFRNFPNFVGIPNEINPRFHKLMDVARINNMNDEERKSYFSSSIDDNEREDIAKANFDYGKEEGRAEGIAEGEAAKAKAIAKKLLAMGLSVEQVAEGTGLSVEEVKALG